MGCLCYIALFVTIYFTVQVVHSSIGFQSVPKFSLRPHVSREHFFVATRYFSLYSCGKIVILLSQHSKRQSLSIQTEVESDWSPGFARDYQADSILVGEASCTKSN